ncbi:hypothetical protein XELAEV_18003367mg [Xenopus laevis]|uniref:Secreted protein n=1 Tax=Xenopus laevis TaxID=8355 RepID=A0A974BNG5_XENLA|nr:hypothetical protein XELAEV_18003367mg [Xenopus laevis]
MGKNPSQLLKPPLFFLFFCLFFFIMRQGNRPPLDEAEVWLWDSLQARKVCGENSRSKMGALGVHLPCK